MLTGGGCEAPRASDDVTITVKEHSANSDGPALVSVFSTYANAINTGDYPTAYEQLISAARGRTGFDDFAQGSTSSFAVTFDIDNITTGGSGLQAHTRFTSVQDPSMGAKGQACSEWKMTYALVQSGGSWLIDRARPDAGYPTAC